MKTPWTFLTILGWALCTSQGIANVVPGDLPPLPPCDVYRQGPLETRELVVYSLPPGDYPDAFERVMVHYRPEYIDPPAIFPDPPDAVPTGLLVDIAIADGQPITYADRRISPMQSIDFGMLLRGRSYPMPARMIAIAGGRSVFDRESGRVIDGEFVVDPGPFNRTGVTFQGFDEVTFADSRPSRHRPADIFIRENDAGEITSVLRCSQLGSVLVPHCSLYEHSGVFDMKYNFRRNQMHLVETIRAHAHGFTRCLTEPLSHGQGDRK